jgi:hypothetical protein
MGFSSAIKEKEAYMARKLQLVSELAGQTARNITRDVDGWKQYLDTASRLYKYKLNKIAARWPAKAVA